MNLSLLGKWRWRLLQEDSSLWKIVLSEKYGSGVGDLVVLGDNNWPRFCSTWWKDVMFLETRMGSNWFSNYVGRKVGNGSMTCFWKDTWVGSMPLHEQFPRLFLISEQQEAKVADIWEGD